MRTCFILLLNLIALQAISQTVPYKFRIRFTDYSALANSKFLISGQNLDTDPQGIISLSIADQFNYVNIESANLKNYEIKFPLEGRAILPKDPSVFVDIFIAQPKPDPLKVISAQMVQSQATFQSAVFKKLEEESRLGYNRIVAALKIDKLDNAGLEKGRLEFFPLISAAANNYLNEAKNFNDAFLTLSNTLNNKGSYEQLNKAIYNYNEIFNLLNANKSNYEQAIATYWNSKELSLKFSNLVDFALEDFHKPFILEINYSYIGRIYEANKEENGKKKKELQTDLKKDMQTICATMSRRLGILGERITNMNTLLNNNTRVEN
ncbi:MAG: hypothetical protein ACOH2A_00290 [Sphingobacteriaceae bacterium]